MKITMNMDAKRNLGWALGLMALLGQPGHGQDQPQAGDALSLSALEDFEDITAGEVPYYKDRKNRALGIRANVVEHRDKFARATATFAGEGGSHDVSLTTLTEEDGESVYRLLINGEVAGTVTNPKIGPGSARDMQPFVLSWRGVSLKKGDVIAIESNSATNGLIPEGDGTAWARGRWRQLDVISDNYQLNPPAGRLAIVIDGNSPDPDDIGATGVMFALLNRAGVNDRLVHLSHSCDLNPVSNPGSRQKIDAENEKRRQEKLHALCGEGIKLFGPFPNLNGYFNCRADQEAAVADLTKAINASTASDPLWIVEAGEPDIIGFALKAAKESQRQHVHVISHHPANDNSGDFFKWSEILDFGVTEHQIGDQNVYLQTKPEVWDWAKDHDEPGIAWIWGLLDYAERDGVVSFQAGKFDCSDAGMLYWWLTGANQGGNKLAGAEDMKRMILSK